MVIRKSQLRRRAEGGPGSVVETERTRRRDLTTMGRIAALFRVRRSLRPAAELWKVPLPDLLSPVAVSGPDHEPLVNILDLAFLGRASTGELDRELDALPCGDTEWTPGHFVDDLFLAELVRGPLALELEDRDVRRHPRFLERVLASAPTDLATVRFRQAIVRELESDPKLAEASVELLTRLYELVALLRASRDDIRLEPLRFRFDVLRAFRDVLAVMCGSFAASTSGLQRLHSVAEGVRATDACRRMEALLDHHDAMASLELEAVVGADGRLRHLEIRKLRERRGNPFFRRPLRRWFDRLRSAYRRYNLGATEVAERLVMGVYHEVAPAMARMLQLICHLEVYAATHAFARRAAAHGLRVCLPEIEDGAPFEVERLFNPLLMPLDDDPVPTDLAISRNAPVALVTGPNSGGKTRLLQAAGLAQVLAQSGLYAPCAGGRMPLAAGVFASIVEADRADQSEGRLGTEMVRLRTLFEEVPPGSLVLLDELCSGTNPSEAIEIVEMVLRLLRRLEPVALVTTHFLDFAHQLRRRGAIEGLVFLQAEVNPERGPTFRFVEGVATTSLAVGTARRLGVTFDELERALHRRTGRSAAPQSEEIGHLPGGDQHEE